MVTTFDYATLGAEDATALHEVAAQISRLEKDSIKARLKIGYLLTQARGILGSRPFRIWASTECGVSPSSATLLIRCHKRFGHLSCADQFSAMAMLVLCKRECPESAFRECVRLAMAGTRISDSVARQVAATELRKKGEIVPHGIQPVPSSVAALRQVVARLTSDALPDLIATMTPADLRELSDRVIGLAISLRDLQPEPDEAELMGAA